MPEVHTVPMPAPTADAGPKRLPPVFRITDLIRWPAPDGCSVHNEAELFHEQAGLHVVWVTASVDSRLQVGTLVSIRWLGKPVSIDGALRIRRLVLQERVIPALNLFETVPSHWVKDREWVKRASVLWDQLSRPFQQLFNAVFWDPHRFRRYLVGPSSINGHHSGVNGNFQHAVEVAEQSLALASVQASPSVLIAAGLLHDAGKADEYRLNPNRPGFVLSERGLLVGHRHTVLEWLAVARATERIILPEAQYLALLHTLTAAKGVEWLGIREPMSLEATILAAADRLSGLNHLVGRLAPEAGPGFGRYPTSQNGRPDVVAGHDVPSGVTGEAPILSTRAVRLTGYPISERGPL